MEERVNELLPLTAKIAREFSNIPNLPHAEIEIVAQKALARAALALDPAKGDFTTYAARRDAQRTARSPSAPITASPSPPLRSRSTRHHFLLEACPPLAALRDLGSMNGTQVSFPKPVSDVWSFAASL